jgi:hypothetical protein
MNDQQKTEQYSGVRDQEIRAALDQHWGSFKLLTQLEIS